MDLRSKLERYKREQHSIMADAASEKPDCFVAYSNSPTGTLATAKAQPWASTAVEASATADVAGTASGAPTTADATPVAHTTADVTSATLTTSDAPQGTLEASSAPADIASSAAPVDIASPGAPADVAFPSAMKRPEYIAPECDVYIEVYSNDFIYGGNSISKMKDLDQWFLSKLSGGGGSGGSSNDPVDMRDLLFLDTETTGLSGGAGTVAFLAGVGYFTDNGFIVKQFLMRDFDEEQSMLKRVELEMMDRKTLVTFNGKAFDVNILAGRFIMNGRRMPNPARHIDLLYTSRKVWKNVLENCRLGTIESVVLGEERIGDIPGIMIPELYFQYLQDRDSALLDGVLLHNRIDIVSMAGVLKYIADIIRCLGENNTSVLGANELYGVGRLLESFGEYAKAENFYKKCIRLETTRLTSGHTQDISLGKAQDMSLGQPQDMPLGQAQDMTLGQAQDMSLGQAQGMSLGQAQDMSLNQPQALAYSINQGDIGHDINRSHVQGLTQGLTLGIEQNLRQCLEQRHKRNKAQVLESRAMREAIIRLAAIRKRAGDYAQAAEHWKSLIKMGPKTGLNPYIELAKYYEHRVKDPFAAFEYVEAARSIVSKLPNPNLWGSNIPEELESRRNRLAGKIQKSVAIL